LQNERQISLRHLIGVSVAKILMYLPIAFEAILYPFTD
jgi:hypothetical protein